MKWIQRFIVESDAKLSPQETWSCRFQIYSQCPTKYAREMLESRNMLDTLDGWETSTALTRALTYKDERFFRTWVKSKEGHLKSKDDFLREMLRAAKDLPEHGESPGERRAIAEFYLKRVFELISNGRVLKDEERGLLTQLVKKGSAWSHGSRKKCKVTRYMRQLRRVLREATRDIDANDAGKADTSPYDRFMTEWEKWKSIPHTFPKQAR